MSKWVTILAAGFMSACGLFVSVMTILSTEPFRTAYLIVWALTVASAWWLIQVVRTPTVSEPVAEPMPAQQAHATAPGTPPGGWMILACVFGTLLWSFLWVGVLAPLIGLGGIPVKLHLIFILGIPLVLLWIRDKLKGKRAQ